MPRFQRLTEFVGEFQERRRKFGTAGMLERGARDDVKLENGIARQYLSEYNKAGKAFVRELGGEDFELSPSNVWKRREIKKQAKVKAQSLKRTFAKERKRIEALPAAERKVAKEAFAKRKVKELNDLVAAEARFQAQTDIIAHSGIADVNKAQVMNFRGPQDRKTCGVCWSIMGGNPYTIARATTLGAKAHPGCRHDWIEDWEVDPNLLANARRQVKDGEVRLWDGSPRTPARGQAVKKVAAMRERKGGWKGKAIEQRKLATQTGQSLATPRTQAEVRARKAAVRARGG